MKDASSFLLVYAQDTAMDIRDLEDTLTWKRNQQAAGLVEQRGFKTIIETLKGKFHFICVLSPDETDYAWATSAEVRHLADIAQNLTPDKAWVRWVPTIEPFRELTDAEIEAMENQTRMEMRKEFSDKHMWAAVTLGRLGGQATSVKKTFSSKENGKLGGRPAKN